MEILIEWHKIQFFLKKIQKLVIKYDIELHIIPKHSFHFHFLL
jgi:hypothetical protein